MKRLIQVFVLFFTGISAASAQSGITLIDHKRFADNMVYVKFNDGTNVKAENGSLSGTVSLPASLSSLGHWRSVYHLPAQQLSQLRAKAERNLGRSLPDPNTNFYFIVNRAEDLQQAKNILQNIAGTERVRYVPVPVNAATPDFFPLQSYPLNISSGINAQGVWTSYGNRGGGIKVCDIEYGFNAAHQDLPPVTVVGPTPMDPFGGGGVDHGTAVLGEIASLDNSYGTTGIAPDCALYFAGAYTGGLYDLAAAIANALTVLNDGDVILLEQQIDGPLYTGSPDQFGLVPVEWYELFYDAIVLAVGQNVTVVEAAGNGQQNLDDAIYSTDNDGHYPFLPENNSGAIIVGAGAVDTAYAGSDVARSKLWYSNYGSRVDLQGNGQAIMTTGYGDYYSIEGSDLWYTSDFGGTSGASPIVTGAVVLMQSVNKSLTGTALTPFAVRDALVATGKPQQAGTYPLSHNIGPLPDVLLALQHVSVAETAAVEGWSLYPNPAGNSLMIKQETAAVAQFSLVDACGRQVFSASLNGNAQVDVSHLPNGLYLAVYSAAGQIQHKKIIVRH